MIRNFMRVTFPKVLDSLFILGIVGVIIAAYAVGSAAQQYVGFQFMAFISVLLPGVIGIIVVVGVIYILMDIRDALQDKRQG